MSESVGAVMARAKGKKSERDDIAVKMDRATVNKAKMVATHRGVSAAEILSEIAKPGVDKAYAQMLRELDGSANPQNKPKGGLKVGSLEISSPEKP